MDPLKDIFSALSPAADGLAGRTAHDDSAHIFQLLQEHDDDDDLLESPDFCKIKVESGVSRGSASPALNMLTPTDACHAVNGAPRQGCSSEVPLLEYDSSILVHVRTPQV